jgi:photosystem II protein
MEPKIQFIKNINENTLPLVKLTKSRNGKTGTATFIFIKPQVFANIIDEGKQIKSMSLIWDNKNIETTDLTIFFKGGVPFILKAILIFKNSQEWFNFLHFMNYYSKETGLSFTEKN